MPNHVTNIVRFAGSREDLASIRSLMEASEGELFDFNALAECPGELLRRSSPFRAEEGESVLDAASLRGRLVRKYGSADWYDWQCRNWGTKWNSYNVEWEDDSMVSFETAWSSPYPVFKLLSEKYPETAIIVAYADEDLGCNCGITVWKAGKSLVVDVGGAEMREEDKESFARHVTGCVFESLEGWLEEQGYESRDEAATDYGEEHLERMENSLESSHPAVKMVEIIKNPDSEPKIIAEAIEREQDSLIS